MYLPSTIKPGETCNLDKIPSRVDPDDIDKKAAYKRIEANAKVMARLAERLYAENKRSVLLVFARHGRCGQGQHDSNRATRR